MLAAVQSATLLGVTGQAVTVEVHVGVGLPAFQIVGLPDDACRESRDRVRAALLSCGFGWPAKRITVNLAPSGVRKGGSGLDLAIAIGVLAANEQVPAHLLAGLGFVGELGLDGSVRPVPGVAPMVAAMGDVAPVVARPSCAEARAVAGDRVRLADRLDQLVGAVVEGPWPPLPVVPAPGVDRAAPDLRDVRGQLVARRALEIAAAGGHHLLLVGPPGSGKTMLAQRLPGILPPLTREQAMEATMIHSAAGVRLPASGVVDRPPFRAPHHSSSMVAMVGGGSHALRPGEVSISTSGVLFLDEMGEFAPSVLDALRQPLEEGVIRVARAHARATLPARFLLVGATNPCPCGGGAPGSCECDETARARYLRRLSGPLMDRFDLRVGVDRTGVDDLLGAEPAEASAVVAARVAAARMVALRRSAMLNAAIPPALLDELVPLTAGARALLRAHLETHRLSGRGLHRIRRVARTIADLDGAADGPVGEEHVALALGLRIEMSTSPRREVA